MLGRKSSIGEWSCVRSAFVNLVVYALVGRFCRVLRRLPLSLSLKLASLHHHLQRDLRDFSHNKVYLTLKTDTMTSALSDNFPPGETLETATRTALAEEEELYQNLHDRTLARKKKLDDTRSSIDWLGSARGAAQVVLDSSADAVSVLSSFVDNLFSVISIHESDQISGDLKQSLPSINVARRSWESVADVVDNLLVQIESLKSATLSHAECMARELGAHKSIEQQTQIALDSLTQSTDALTHSMDYKRRIFHPLRRVPTEILANIFELATLDERLALRRHLNFPVTPYSEKKYFYRSIPRIPTILASTCRRWRMIALNMARLWSFLCVPRSVNCTSAGFLPPEFVVGLSTFQQAKSCIGASECELVVGPSGDWRMVTGHLLSIPPSQISTMNIVLPPDWLDFSQFPTASVLRIIGVRHDWREPSVLPPSIFLPTSVLARTRDLSCRYVLPDVDSPIISVKSLSLTFHSTRFPDLGLFLARFPNLTALTLSVEFGSPHPEITFTPLHHARIRTLSITDDVVPYLCASLQRGALSFPSLTRFILLRIRNSTGEWSQLQSLLVNVTRFEIRAATRPNCGSNIRRLLDAMPLLQQFTLFGTAVDDGLGALLVAPIKRIGKLIISDSKADGSNVKSYYDALKSGSGDPPDDNSSISIHFMNCPYILPHIREQLSS